MKPILFKPAVCFASTNVDPNIILGARVKDIDVLIPILLMAIAILLMVTTLRFEVCIWGKYCLGPISMRCIFEICEIHIYLYMFRV